MNDLVSIIVPVFNVEKYLTECIESLIDQSYKKLEIILIDDGSTDSSGAICDKFADMDSRIKVYHKNNAGVSAARNIGIEKSTGKYITFVDSDDFVDKDYIYFLYNNLMLYNSDLSVCSFSKFTKKDKKNCNNLSDICDTNCFDANDALNKMFDFDSIQGFICCKLYKAKIIKNVRFDSEVKLCEDLLFIIECLKYASKVSYSSSQLYYYRQRKNSSLNRINNNKLSVFIALNRLYNLYYSNINFKNFYFNFYAKCKKNINIKDVKYDFSKIFFNKDIYLKNKLVYFIYNFFPFKFISKMILLKQKMNGYFD